jgi:uncharacterized protein (TIGR02594 family)
MLPETLDEPDWITIARRELGEHEIAGTRHNARILEYQSVTRANEGADEVPWCAAFVGWALEQAGEKSTKSAAARSYLHWGREVSTPLLGAVAVLVRGENPRQGHVGFVVGVEPNGDLQILGGNQSDSVCVKRYTAHRLLSLRMPGRAA